MTDYDSTVLTPILANPILSKCGYQSLARLLPHVVEKTFESGAAIFKAGEPATHMFLLLSGKSEVETPELTRVMARDGEGKLVALEATDAGVEQQRVLMSHGQLGEEAATGTSAYMSNATAVGTTHALAIPREKLAMVIAANPHVAALFYEALIYRFGGQPARQFEGADVSQTTAVEDGTWRKIWGLLCTIVSPVLVMLVADQFQVERGTAAFLAILTATTSLWVFELVDEYIPALFAVLAILLLGVAPVPIVLSGFSSGGFFMAMSILGLGALIVASGLSYRFLLLLLNKLPNQPIWQHVGLLLTGILLTPLVPSMSARVALVGPFMTDMADILGYKPKSKGVTEMAVGALGGATIFSPVFLTSKSANFVVFGLLTLQHQEQFNWLAWAIAGGVYGLTMLAIYAIMVIATFPRNTTRSFSKEQISSQLHLLGKLKVREKAALVGITVFGVGVVSASLHNVKISWLGLSILFALLLFGFLRKSEFREKIDWTLLIYLGGLGGIMGAFNHLGLNAALANELVGLGSFMRTDFHIFVLLVLGVIFLLRLVLPINAAIVLCAAILMPLGDAHGVHPWVVGFIALTFGELWFFKYQCYYYNQFRAETGGSSGFEEKTFLRFNARFNVLKVVGILASIPLWTFMGLL
jgi:divalent anion:Na+ symporter, DASS family